MKKIFVLIDYYLPGYKSGGPLRTISNMVDQMHEHFDFWILTRDRDKEDSTSYNGVKVNDWNRVGNANIFYASPGKLSIRNIRRLISDTQPDIVYLNSFFSPLQIKYLLCRKLGLVEELPTVLAPRGEFSPGALKIKQTKKSTYIAMVKHMHLYDRLLWQASTQQEEAEIRAVWGSDIKIHVAPDLSPSVFERNIMRNCPPTKRAGSVKFVFLSRISPKKNLLFALTVLQNIHDEVLFDIYGPIEDRHYWEACLHAIKSLPANIVVKYRGSMPNDVVPEVLSNYHFFLLPTLGENFGHAILEALSSGCPAIISDQTPWSNLVEQQAGWTLPLSDVERWQEILQQCVYYDEPTYLNMSRQAKRYAACWLSRTENLTSNVSLFTTALATN
ncbi:MAG: glycosyltransferase family 4 protein [Acidobacteriota bacterium]